MKIAKREVIQDGEQELIDAITGELDWGAMEEIFEKEHRLKLNEDVAYKSGDIVIHNDQVAYRLEFDVKVTLSVLIDRNGSCLSLTSSDDFNRENDADEDHPSDGPDRPDGIESSPSHGDGQILEDQTVTIRDRDTLKQERIPADKVVECVRERMSAM